MARGARSGAGRLRSPVAPARHRGAQRRAGAGLFGHAAAGPRGGGSDPGGRGAAGGGGRGAERSVSRARGAGPLFGSCGRLEPSPIVSVYLWFGSDITDLRFAGLVGGEWQWLFNRRAFPGRESGGHAVTLVRSAARTAVDATRDALVDSALEEVRRYVPAARRAALRHALVIKERRASLSPSPGGMALRPPAGGSRPGLYLAGDWT